MIDKPEDERWKIVTPEQYRDGYFECVDGVAVRCQFQYRGREGENYIVLDPEFKKPSNIVVWFREQR